MTRNLHWQFSLAFKYSHEPGHSCLSESLRLEAGPLTTREVGLSRGGPGPGQLTARRCRHDVHSRGEWTVTVYRGHAFTLIN